MKHASPFPNSLFLSLLYVLGLILGCTTTIVPERTQDSTISFDGNEQNGGFLGYTTSGYGVLTPRARERYNDLIARGYGTNCNPPLKLIDAGLAPHTNGTFLITKEHLVKFGVMNTAKKSGL